MADSIEDLIRFGLPDDYYETYPRKLRNLRLAEVSLAARRLISVDQLLWIVVGDLSRIEKGIRELNLGEIHHIDADGNPVQ